MKTNCLLFAFLILISFHLKAQNNAAYLAQLGDYYRCGDITVSGNKLTVEALVKMDGTGYYATGQSAYDIVSKHRGAEDINYLLRPDHCELTTTNGYYYTTITQKTSFIKDSFYHMAMVYDGATLKFYVNGCVFSEVSATGNVATNSYITTIGQLAAAPGTIYNEQFFGYIDEVRIWNVARTQDEIKNNMQDLPNPTTQAGLLAYYKFEGNAKNVQGNSSFDATPVGGATIGAQNGFTKVKPFSSAFSVNQPSCTGGDGSVTLLPDGGKSPYKYSKDGVNYISTNEFNNLSEGTYTFYVKADGDGCSKDTTVVLTNKCTTTTTSFTSPDTVCVNAPVTITNTSTGASSYYWNFCVANVNTPPAGVNFGNLNKLFQAPVYIDYVYDNGNYYGFMTNNYPGNLLRLDFGNSLLNTPSVTDLGTVGGVIPGNTEGIQIVKSAGNWYLIIVGGDPADGVPSRIVKIELGTNITNNAPVGTNWGNIGNLAYPHDLYVFDDGGHWYGLTVNTSNNTITRFDFTTSFSNTPAAINLGNIGNLNGPTGVYAFKDNGLWYAFVTNATSSSLTRLNFGTSLLNTPTGQNLGNIDGKLHSCWDIQIMKFCGEMIGFLINADGSYNDLIKLDFNGSVTNTPTAMSYGNIGNLSFPHCLSRIFRAGADLYSFIPNVNNNTLSRIRFIGCNNSSIPNSNLQNPPAVVYSSPGTYNINLTVDDGLATQASYCRQVVVVAPPAHSITKNYSLCQGDSIKLSAFAGYGGYTWNSGLSTDSIITSINGTYWVESNKYSCYNRDSFIVAVNSRPVINLGKDTSVCLGSSIALSTHPSGTYNYSWLPATGLSNTSSDNTSASPVVNTQYIVTATNSFSCSAKDTINVTVRQLPNIKLGADTSICVGDSIILNAGNAGSTYNWQNGNILQTLVAKDSGLYYVKVTSNGCNASDTMHLSYNPLPVFKVRSDTSICFGQSVPLTLQSAGNYVYNWFPATGLSSISIPNPNASPTSTISYIVTGKDNLGCLAKDTVTITVNQKPLIAISDPVEICQLNAAQLHASGGINYQWYPSQNLSSPNVSNPLAAPLATTTYYVTVTDQNLCSNIDSVTVSVRSFASLNKPADRVICHGDSVQLVSTSTLDHHWSPEFSLSNPNISNPYAFPDTTTNYTLIINDPVCNRDTSFTVLVTVNPKPDVQAKKSNDIDCSVPGSQLTASGATEYSWHPASGLDNPLRSNPIAILDTTTTFIVTGTNEFGCSNYDTVTVNVTRLGKLTSYLPNAFTPNGDGLNDCFGVSKWGAVNNLDLSIYNRWGELVFYTKDPGYCWDGTFKGKKQPIGVYVYMVKANTTCGNVFLRGTVTLIR